MANSSSSWTARILPEGGTARKVLTVSSGSAAGYIISMLLAPVLTRLFTPADFGLLAIYISVMALITTFATLSLEVAIPVVAEESEARAMLAISIVSVLITTFASLFVLLILRHFPTKYQPFEALKPFYWIVPIGTLGTGCHLVLSTWGIRQRAYGNIARAKFTQITGQVVLQVMLGFFKIMPGALLFGDALGRLMGSATFLRLGQVWKDLFVRPSTWRHYAATTWLNKRLFILGFGFNNLNVFAQQVGLLCLPFFYSPWDIGLFALSLRFTSLPILFIGKAASQVFLGETAHATRDRPESFYRFFVVAIKKLNWVGLIIGTFIIVLSPLLIGRVLGAQWKIAGWIMAIRAPAAWIQLIAVPVSGGLVLLRRQDLQIVWEIGRIVLTGGAVIVVGKLHGGLIAVTVALTVVELLYHGSLIGLILRISRSKAGQN